MKPIAKKALAKPAVKVVAKKTAEEIVSKLVVGKTYGYRCRTNPAKVNDLPSTVPPFRGKLQEIDQKATGYWVKLHDKQNDRIITVRPSQVTK